INGNAQGEFALSGTIGDPHLEGTLASSLQYADIGPASVRARTAVTRSTLRVDEIDARLRDSGARGSLRLAIDTGRLDGTLDLSLKDLNALSGALPAAARPTGALDVHASLSGTTTTPRVDADVTSAGLSAAGQHVDRLEARVHSLGASIVIERFRVDSGE